MSVQHQDSDWSRGRVSRICRLQVAPEGRIAKAHGAAGSGLRRKPPSRGFRIVPLWSIKLSNHFGFHGEIQHACHARRPRCRNEPKVDYAYRRLEEMIVTAGTATGRARVENYEKKKKRSSSNKARSIWAARQC